MCLIDVMKKNNVDKIADSSIARESNDVFYTWSGLEISVSSTEFSITQIVSFYMIDLDFAIKKVL